MNRPLVLLCDLDGTLVDSNAHLSQCVTDLLNGYGLPFTPAQFYEPQHFFSRAGIEKRVPIYGGTWDDVYDYALYKSGQSFDHAAFFARVEEIVHAPGVITPPRAGMAEALRTVHLWAQEEKIPLLLAAVTNGKDKEASRNINVMEKEGFSFPVIVTADDAELNGRGKPYPDPYLLAYRRLRPCLHGAAPVALTLEDSIPGHEAALAMAMQTPDTFSFYLPHHDNRPARHPLEMVLTDLDGLPEAIRMRYQEAVRAPMHPGASPQDDRHGSV
jgi:beta-phosphoglucomutase-like phosphatase (HAD superfamily)